MITVSELLAVKREMEARGWRGQLKWNGTPHMEFVDFIQVIVDVLGERHADPVKSTESPDACSR